MSCDSFQDLSKGQHASAYAWFAINHSAAWNMDVTILGHVDKDHSLGMAVWSCELNEVCSLEDSKEQSGHSCPG